MRMDGRVSSLVGRVVVLRHECMHACMRACARMDGWVGKRTIDSFCEACFELLCEGARLILLFLTRHQEEEDSPGGLGG